MSANCGDYGGGGLEYVMNFPSLSCLTSFTGVHLLCTGERPQGLEGTNVVLDGQPI